MNKQQRKIIDDKILQVWKISMKLLLSFVRSFNHFKNKKDKFNLEKYIEDLRSEIAPLMILEPGASSKVASFILRTEKLFTFILDGNKSEISNIETYVHEMCGNILEKSNLTEIKENKDNIMRVFQDMFWEDLTFDDVEFLIKDIAPLMKYYEPERGTIIQSDVPDYVINRETFEKEIIEDEELKKLLSENLIVKKIKDGEGITSLELLELEKQLIELKPGLTIDNIQNYQQKDFFTFLREILDLSFKEDPKELIKKRFDILSKSRI